MKILRALGKGPRNGLGRARRRKGREADSGTVRNNGRCFVSSQAWYRMRDLHGVKSYWAGYELSEIRQQNTRGNGRSYDAGHVRCHRVHKYEVMRIFLVGHTLCDAR